MVEDLTPFPCNACGECCRHVHLSSQTAFLDRGDGICRHFDERTNLCTIYEMRPLVCRVQEYYETYLNKHISWGKFIKINVEICHILQNNIIKPKK